MYTIYYIRNCNNIAYLKTAKELHTFYVSSMYLIRSLTIYNRKLRCGIQSNTFELVFQPLQFRSYGNFDERTV